MSYIAVVRHDAGRILKFAPFPTLSEAQSHAATFGGFAAPQPTEGRVDGWVADELTQTVTYVAPEPVPTYPTAEAAITAMVDWIDDLHAKVTGPVPQGVKFGWKAKGDWARSWDEMMNPHVPVIYADEMAAAGTAKYPDVASFVARVIAKADFYEGVVADTEGLRTKTQDLIEAEAAKPNPDSHQYEVILQAAMAEAVTMAAARGITLPNPDQTGV